MEKRVTTLEVLMNQTAKSIDRLDRSIIDLRGDLNHSIKDGIQLAGLVAMIGALARLTQAL